MSWLKDMWDKFASAEARAIGDAHPDNRSLEPQPSSLDRIPYNPPVNPGITSNTDSGGPRGDSHGGGHHHGGDHGGHHHGGDHGVGDHGGWW